MGLISKTTRAAGGTGPATTTSPTVSRKVSQRPASDRVLDPPPNGPARPTPSSPILDDALDGDVARLERLRVRGLLTDDEFETATARMLEP